MNHLFGRKGVFDRESGVVNVSKVEEKYFGSVGGNISGHKLLSKILLWKGDITKLKVDAIVNAANETLLGGGGVDGAIHAAAGPRLLDECEKLNGCKTGEAKITKGYKLPAKFVVHTVGPIYRGRESDAEMLSNCYKNSLDFMIKENLRTIAFPCISTGIYRYPNRDAAELALQTVICWLRENQDTIERIIFCVFLQRDEDIYRNVIENAVKQLEHTGKEEAGIHSGQSSVDVEMGQLHGSEQKINLKPSPVTTAERNDKQQSNIMQQKDDENLSNDEKLKMPCQPDEHENDLSAAGSKAEYHSELTNTEREKWIEKFKSLELECNRPILTDTEKWLKEKNFPALKLVGGLDISYHKTKSDVACVSLVVLSFPELKLLHEDTSIEVVSVPYIPGYLAYREAEHFYKKVQKVKETELCPQIILVDGNGLLHPRKYGSAVKVGVDTDLPTIGVAKNLMIMEELGIDREKIGNLKGRGSMNDLSSRTGEVLGKVMRSSDASHKPIYVSVGHKCSLDSAALVTLACCKNRIPEPIRQADHLSKMRLKKELG